MPGFELNFFNPMTCDETINIIVINENIPIYIIQGYGGVRAEFRFPMTCHETIKIIIINENIYNIYNQRECRGSSWISFPHDLSWEVKSWSRHVRYSDSHQNLRLYGGWCGSGSRGIKWREKQIFFSQEIIFFKSEPKKVANL